ncbi:hypothetical protein [Streptomyces sp. NPDC010273]|uniref:hypothetical protein n=1 Tax=Streptomyces sp. NPDC010273 TaxID=3364829 RepID=UPI0036EF1D78
MSAAVTCEVCHQPIRSAAARARRIGGRCWRKLRPGQRAAIRRAPSSVRAVLRQPARTGDGQLSLDEKDSTQ